MKIWLSYYNKDRYIGDKILNFLQKTELEVIDSNSVISPGDSIFEKMYHLIQESDVYLIILSKNSSSDNFYPPELSLILSEYKKHPNKKIIPLIIDKDVVFPPFLTQFLGIKLTNYSKFEDFTNKLIQAIQIKEAPIHSEDKSFRYFKDEIEMNQLLIQKELQEFKISREQEIKQFKVFIFSFFLTLIGIVLSLISLFFLPVSIDSFTAGIILGAIFGIVLSIIFYYYGLRNRRRPGLKGE
jgi:hypothetical protein